MHLRQPDSHMVLLSHSLKTKSKCKKSKKQEIELDKELDKE